MRIHYLLYFRISACTLVLFAVMAFSNTNAAPGNSRPQRHTVAEINEEAIAAYQMSDRGLTRKYKMLLRHVGDDTALKKAVVISQQQFLAYRKAEGELYETRYRGGSMLPTFKYRALKRVTDARRRQLMFYYENM